MKSVSVFEKLIRILVTGGAGYIGSHMVQILGHAVVHFAGSITVGESVRDKETHLIPLVLRAAKDELLELTVLGSY